MPRPTVDALALYKAIEKRRRRLGLSRRRAAEQITGSVNPSLLTRLREGRPVTADTLCSVMIWLGEYDIRPFLLVMNRGHRFTADMTAAATPGYVRAVSAHLPGTAPPEGGQGLPVPAAGAEAAR